MKKLELFRALMATGNWGEVETKLGIEFDFKCAYCDKDLLESVDNFKEWQKDHIVPSSKGGLDEDTNLALSCRTCNFIKSRWDPRLRLGSNPTKADLVNVAREHVSEKRKEAQSEINSYLEIIKLHS